MNKPETSIEQLLAMDPEQAIATIMREEGGSREDAQEAYAILVGGGDNLVVDENGVERPAHSPSI